jgi:hypothetical protein
LATTVHLPDSSHATCKVNFGTEEIAMNWLPGVKLVGQIPVTANRLRSAKGQPFDECLSNDDINTLVARQGTERVNQPVHS